MNDLEVPEPTAARPAGDPAPRRSTPRKRDKPAPPAASAKPSEPMRDDGEAPGTLDLLT